MSVLKARPGHVLIQILKEETQEGGYLLPDSVNEKPAKGSIVHSEELKQGTVVRFRRYSGQEFREDGKDLLLIKLEDVLGVYE